MLTAAILATAVLGTTVNLETGEGTKPARLLNPRTLAPIKGTPRLPPNSRRFALSPNRERVAVLSDRGLRVYGIKSRKLQLRTSVGSAGELTWIARNRILATGCDDAVCGLTTVDPSRGRVLRRRTLPTHELPLTERVGKRWLLEMRRRDAPAPPSPWSIGPAASATASCSRTPRGTSGCRATSSPPSTPTSSPAANASTRSTSGTARSAASPSPG
jgi:hypothetical protein